MEIDFFVWPLFLGFFKWLGDVNQSTICVACCLMTLILALCVHLDDIFKNKFLMMFVDFVLIFYMFLYFGIDQ